MDTAPHTRIPFPPLVKAGGGEVVEEPESAGKRMGKCGDERIWSRHATRAGTDPHARRSLRQRRLSVSGAGEAVMMAAVRSTPTPVWRFGRRHQLP